MANDQAKRSLLDQLTASATQPPPAVPDVLAPAVSGDLGAFVPPSLAESPATAPGSTANLESIAASPDTLNANVEATKQSAANDNPGFLKKLARVAGGLTGLADPNSSPQAGIGAKIGALAGRTGNALAEAAGTPEQKQLAEERSQMPLKMAQIQNEREYRQGILGNKAAETGVHQQNADTKGQMADVAQQNSDSATKLHATQVKKIEAELQGMNYVDPNLAHALGRDDLADKMISPIAYQQQIGNVAKSRGFHTMDLLKEGTWAVDNVGRKIYQITPDSASLSRAEAYQGSKPVIDIDPTTGQQQYDRASNATANHLLPGSAGHQMLSIWQPALDSGERLQVMQANLDRGLKGDQQAMLSLLANHLGMTMGLQKGARLNQAIISEAEQSRPWLEGMQAKFDDRGYLKGVVLSPQQMRQMVELGEQRYQSDVQKARYEAPFAGLNEEPMLPVNPENLTNNPMPQALPKRGVPQKGTTVPNSSTPPANTAGELYQFPDGSNRMVSADKVKRALAAGAKKAR